MNSCPSEDKTCRMCGYADQSNLNIFQTKQIHKKILALYPIVIYKSDPLPKNICLKCYGNTLSKYDDYLRISKIQNKWINNVRNNQPNNPYIKVLDKIDEANVQLMQNLHKLSEGSLDEPIHLVKYGNDFPEDISISQHNLSARPSLDNSNANKSQPTLDMKKFPTISNSREISLLPPSSNNKMMQNPFASNRGQLEKIESMLKSNGCTLTSLADTKSFKMRHHPAIDFKNFPKNKCRYCFRTLPNQKFLAFHQVKLHFNLLSFKCFTKKLLPKRFRLGIKIKINNETCVRCHNCWNCYDNYESILNHWQNKRCEFYCLICGREYPKDPYNLRKHILEEHFLKYKYYKKLIRKNDTLKAIKAENELPKDIKSENDPHLANLKKDTIENSNSGSEEKPKIPVLKLKRKTNSEKEEFDIKISESCSLKMLDTSSLISTQASIRPLLRVKDLSELQKPVEEDPDEYISLADLKLNTLNLDGSSSSSSIKRKYSDEI